jgi:steroid 5-alpha reductase family enzyme
MMEQILYTSLYGFAFVFSLMTMLWVIYRLTNKPMIVDAGWGYGLALIGIFYAFLGDGDLTRRIIIGSMAAIWGFRLGSYLLFTRVLGRHHDARYDMLEQGWKKNIPFRYFLFYQYQAIAIVLVTVQFIVISNNPSPTIAPLEYAGIGLWLLSVIGQTISDAQLNAFKNDPTNKGKVCRVGLWNYSRHPNYFFEWLIWMAYLIFALASDGGWIAVFAPAIMLYLLLRVTGIPLTEENAIKSKGDLYREYQRTTSAFVPWFRKK